MGMIPDKCDARTYAFRWQQAGDALDRERLCELRGLSEREAAQRFILLSRGVPLAPLRPGSGLVEQQKVFGRLARKQDGAAACLARKPNDSSSLSRAGQ